MKPMNQRRLVCRYLKGDELVNATKEERQEMLSVRQKDFVRKYTPFNLPHYEQPKCSQKSYPEVPCYGVCTNQGLVRQYNEDRVSVIFALVGDNEPVYYFGLFDGHGGARVCNHLRDHLHKYILVEDFAKDPHQTILRGILRAETEVLEQAVPGDNSGSTVLLTIIHNNTCYIVNVGDCRALLSSRGGKVVAELSRDHKPSDQAEQSRILQAQGEICQYSIVENEVQVEKGPLRVVPGQLSVSRSVGDPEAKRAARDVVICHPEIASFQLAPTHEYILMGSDGIFDKMSSREAAEVAGKQLRTEDLHSGAKLAAMGVVAEAMNRSSEDNLTCVFVGLGGMARLNPRPIRG